MYQKLERITPIIENIEKSVTQLSYEQLKIKLADTRQFHYELFRDLNNKLGLYAGKYRGETTEYLKNYDFGCERQMKVFQANFAHEVKENIHELELVILRLDTNLTAKEYYKRIVFIYWCFLIIHPYIDGNGHISRLLFKSLIDRHPKLKVAEDFTISPSPFSGCISEAIRLYREYPELLESYLKNWILEKPFP